MTTNTVILSGNVTNVFDEDEYVKLIIADNYGKDKSRYIPIYARDKAADFARNHIDTGDHISISGYISCTNYKPAIQATMIAYEGYKSPKKIDAEMTALFNATE